MAQYISQQKIRDYIINDIRQSIENDVGIAIRAYNQSFFNNGPRGGFFAVPRMLFPEIDGLGSYLTGNPKATGLNIKTYLSEIMSHIDQRYKTHAAFIALIYRHGLLHQHAPKNFKYRQEQFGWMFSINELPISPAHRNEHLSKFQTNNGKILSINMNIFYRDVINSVKFAADEIISNHVEEFRKSFLQQNRFLTKHGELQAARRNGGNRRYIFPSDFSFLEH